MPIDTTAAATQAPGPAAGGLRLELALPGRRQVSAAERMFFTEQLALLLETGTSLHAALRILAGQAQSAGLQRLIRDLADTVEEGKPFSIALAEHPNVFDQTYVNLVAASESGGFMHDVLEQLLDMDKQRAELAASLVSAFTYPAFLGVFSIAVVAFVLAVVFPQFDEMFVRLGDELPGSTRFLMGVSDLLVHGWPALLTGAIGAVLAARLWAMSTTGKRLIDRAKLAMPGARAFFVELYLVQSMRVMGMSLTGGVSLMDTLQACRSVARNAEYEAFIDEVAHGVEEGAGIASGFDGSPFVPPLVQQMVRTGEETGNLARVMTRVADYYEQRLTQRLQLMSNAAEPIMLIVMGAIVGIIVASLILPIFKLSGSVH